MPCVPTLWTLEVKGLRLAMGCRSHWVQYADERLLMLSGERDPLPSNFPGTHTCTHSEPRSPASRFLFLSYMHNMRTTHEELPGRPRAHEIASQRVPVIIIILLYMLIKGSFCPGLVANT